VDQHLFQERVLDTLEGHSKQLTEIRVTLAQSYVTKKDLAQASSKATSARRFAITAIISVAGVLSAAILNIV